jgi:hypothetical protein
MRDASVAFNSSGDECRAWLFLPDAERPPLVILGHGEPIGATTRVMQRAECTLTFPTARDGLRALLSRRAIGRIVEGMNTGATRPAG